MPQTQCSPEDIRRMYVDEELNTNEIGALIGCRGESVRRRLVRMGIDRRPGGVRGEKHPCWKGGRTVDKDGYVLVHRPEHPDSNSNGYIREHRLVMEQKLGRRLGSHEVVHHMDDDHANNDPSNLELYDSNAEHLRQTIRGQCPDWTEDGKRRIAAAVDKRRACLPSDRVVDLYTKQLLSAAEIGRRFGVTLGPVLKLLKQLGVPIRQSGHRRGRYTRKWPSKEEWQSLYEKHSIPEIAAAVKCAQASVLRWLQFHGIRTRARGEEGKRQLAKHRQLKSSGRPPRPLGVLAS